MSKHTPGPWEVSEDDPCEIQREGNGDFVAMVLPAPELGWDMNAEREANARLIAAAPDLLAALRAARGYVSQPKVLAAILSAIAKATGGEP